MKLIRLRGFSLILSVIALSTSLFARDSLAVGPGHGHFDWRTRLVNCHAPGASIQRTIDHIVLGGPITVVIRGACSGDVNVARDDTALVAHEEGGTVDGTINIVGTQRVSIDGLTVTGDGDGISARDNASATIRNAMVTGNTGSGVSVLRSALVILHDNEISGNGEYGVLVTDGANVQIRGGNTIESDVADWLNVGAAIGAYRNATVRIRDGGNVIRNTAMVPVVSPPSPGPLPPGIPPPPPSPPISTQSFGFALDVEHNTSFRQDNGHATIVGHVEIFNLTSADFRDTDLTGHIFVDGLAANVRLRNSSITGGMTMFGEANVRDTVNFTGDIFCSGNFLNPNVVPSPPGMRINCAPEIFQPPPGPVF